LIWQFLMKPILNYRFTAYAFSNKNLFFSNGRFNAKIKKVPINAVQSFEIINNILDAKYKAKSFRFFAGETTKDSDGDIMEVYDYWNAVEHADEVEELLKKEMKFALAPFREKEVFDNFI
jgi:uncharacterized membrane protein YdbT with pleckstrin-like domain